MPADRRIRGLAAGALAALALLTPPAWSQYAAQGDMTGIQVRIVRDHRIEKRRAAIVMQDWLYCYPPTGDVILVPKGYMTDFASIPPLADRLIDVFGDNVEAAVVHDWLYAVGQPGRREAADDLFRYALKEQGVGLVTRNAMHAAVKLGGGGAYGRAGEWDRRFRDPLTGKPLARSPFKRRTSAVVTRLSDCRRMESIAELGRLQSRFGSSQWPRAVR